MTRRRAKVLALGLAALALATTGVMLWSIFGGVMWMGYIGHRAGSIRIDRGRFSIEWLHDAKAIVVGEGWYPEHGFGIDWLPTYLNDSFFSSASVPLWMPWVPTIVLTAFLIRAARRPRPGLCLACGYNLTGALSPTCPECGRVKSNAERSP